MQIELETSYPDKEINYVKGHYSTLGKDAGKMKNPMWKIGEEYIFIECANGVMVKLCPESYQKILNFEEEHNNGKKLTFYKIASGYICSTTKLYIHQIIMDCYGNGKGTKNVSVDHIDRDPLNNTMKNLRVATREEQEQNSKGIAPDTKRARKTGAKNLPEGITQKMMRKYVVYYHEWLDKEKTKFREFFKVETHPKLDKMWVGTKSNKISIIEKLEQANKIVSDLENDIYPKKEAISTLPKYVSLTNLREKPHLIFEKRHEGKRLNVTMVLPEEYDLNEQLQILNTKVGEKYTDVSISI
jgi:hypothetical protein